MNNEKRNKVYLTNKLRVKSNIYKQISYNLNRCGYLDMAF